MEPPSLLATRRHPFPLPPSPPAFGVSTVSQDVNVLALVKGNERYVFLFDDDHRVEVLRTLGRFAADPELSFTWNDAVMLSQKVKQVLEDSSVYNQRFILPLSSNEDRE